MSSGKSKLAKLEVLGLRQNRGQRTDWMWIYGKTVKDGRPWNPVALRKGLKMLPETLSGCKP